MRKSRPHKRVMYIPIEKYRRNEKILAPQIFVIDEKGEGLGVIPTSQAIQAARQRELDLVEVNPKADPPVAKFLDYGKFQYQQEKIARKQKSKQKKIDIKGVRLSLRIGSHDLDIRKTQAMRFLEEGNKVKIEMILRGRERQYVKQAKQVYDAFIASLGERVGIETPFSNQGGRITALITKK